MEKKKKENDDYSEHRYHQSNLSTRLKFEFNFKTTKYRTFCFTCITSNILLHTKKKLINNTFSLVFSVEFGFSSTKLYRFFYVHDTTLFYTQTYRLFKYLKLGWNGIRAHVLYEKFNCCKLLARFVLAWSYWRKGTIFKLLILSSPEIRFDERA